MLELKENEIITLKPGDTILAQNKLGFPILIYAAQSPQTTILVSNADIENSMQLQMQPEVEKRTSEIIDEIRKVENFIQKRDYIQASSTIASLKLKNKNISSILFLSGTVNYLTNNKSLAIEDLQSGLQIDPSNGPAKKLLEKLRGNL